MYFLVYISVKNLWINTVHKYAIRTDKKINVILVGPGQVFGRYVDGALMHGQTKGNTFV